MPYLQFIASHPAGPSVLVEVQRLPLGMQRFRYSIRTWRTCSEDLAQVFLMAWRDWDKALPFGVDLETVDPPRGWSWVRPEFDADDSFEAYCNRRMLSSTGFRYGPP